MNKFTGNQKIGEIVTKFPTAAEIFQKYRLDFCCGGDRTLSTAIKEDKVKISEEKILEEINKAYEIFLERSEKSEKRDWTEAPIDELVDHIINTHHKYLFDNLPKISKLTMTILRVHGNTHPELSQVHKLFNSIKMELEEHLIKEETIQYPAIREYLKTKSKEDLRKAVNIIRDLEEEHTNAGNILKELRRVTNDYKIPDDVCETFELTYAKLQEMESDIFRHIHLENNILFPRLLALEK